MPWENSVAYFKSESTLSAFDPTEFMTINLDAPHAACEAENDHDYSISSSTRSEKSWKRANRCSTHLTTSHYQKFWASLEHNQQAMQGNVGAFLGGMKLIQNLTCLLHVPDHAA